MQLFVPQVQLFKVFHLDGPDAYILHAIIWTDQTNYREDGYQISEFYEHQNKYCIVLHAIRDESIPDLNSLTPLAYTIDLGRLQFADNDGILEVTCNVNDHRSRSLNATTLGTALVLTDDAIENSRPIIR